MSSMPSSEPKPAPDAAVGTDHPEKWTKRDKVAGALLLGALAFFGVREHDNFHHTSTVRAVAHAPAALAQGIERKLIRDYTQEHFSQSPWAASHAMQLELGEAVAPGDARPLSDMQGDDSGIHVVELRPLDAATTVTVGSADTVVSPASSVAP